MRWALPLLILAAAFTLAAKREPQREFVPQLPSSALPASQAKLAYSVIIENRRGGMIRIVDPPAQFLLHRPGVDLGKVLRPASSVDPRAYHASNWGEPMTLVASSVNALHLKMYDNPKTKRAGVITVLPAELLDHTLEGRPSKPTDAAIYTDIPGGHGIFGGSHPLIVGNPVSIYRGGRRVSFAPDNVEVYEGDVIIVEVRTPEVWPRLLTVENRAGGAVALVDAAGNTIDCGTMSKPVAGSGRFAGGVFCACGGIRATHTAVLDLDFSPANSTGGLQLIPYEHSKSDELTYAQNAAPYGILVGPGGSDMRAQAPVFYGFLYPSSNFEAPAVLPQLTVSVQLGASTDWQPLPELRGRQELTGLTGLRVDWTPCAEE